MKCSHQQCLRAFCDDFDCLCGMVTNFKTIQEEKDLKINYSELISRMFSFELCTFPSIASEKFRTI